MREGEGEKGLTWSRRCSPPPAPGSALAPQLGFPRCPRSLLPTNAPVLEDGGCGLHTPPASGLPEGRAYMEVLPCAWPGINVFCMRVNIHPGSWRDRLRPWARLVTTLVHTCRFWLDLTWHRFAPPASSVPGWSPEGPGRLGLLLQHLLRGQAVWAARGAVVILLTVTWL